MLSKDDVLRRYLQHLGKIRGESTGEVDAWCTSHEGHKGGYMVMFASDEERKPGDLPEAFYVPPKLVVYQRPGR